MTKTRKSMRSYIIALAKEAAAGKPKAIRDLAALALLFEEAAAK